MTGIGTVIEAIEKGDRDALRAALDTHPDLAAARDSDGTTVVMKAIYGGRKDFAELIADHMDEIDLFTAAALGRMDVLETRVNASPEAVDVRAADGFTALHLAAYFGGPDAVRLLLARGADLTAVADNPMRVRPLNSAVAGGHTESVRVLLAAGADVNAVQQQDITPLMGAAAGGRREIVEFLLEAGADKTLRSADGSTAADYARQRGHDDLALLLAP